MSRSTPLHSLPIHLPTCPYCDGAAAGPAFPFSTQFAGNSYDYLGCSVCGTHFITPAPDAAALDRLYAPTAYHDCFYADAADHHHAASAARLAAYLGPGAKVLDYGCGSGDFIRAARAAGLAAEGAEHNAAAAAQAALRSGARVFDVSVPDWQDEGPWDCIHLGDVVEHMPQPREQLASLLRSIRPGGLLSVEGPLEVNASLVYACIRINDRIRRALGRRQGDFPPYHLIFTDAAAQRALFNRLGATLTPLEWSVHETGWPYRANGVMRNLLALAAIGISRLPWARGRIGNRFSALFRLGGTDQD